MNIYYEAAMEYFNNKFEGVTEFKNTPHHLLGMVFFYLYYQVISKIKGLLF